MLRNISKKFSLLLAAVVLIGSMNGFAVSAQEETAEKNQEEQLEEEQSVPLTLSIKDDIEGQLTVGAEVTVSVEATGGAGSGYEYQFADEDGIILEEYSTDNTYTFYTEEGENTVLITVKDSNENTAVYEYKVTPDMSEKAAEDKENISAGENVIAAEGEKAEESSGAPSEEKTPVQQEKQQPEPASENSLQPEAEGLTVDLVSSKTQKEYLARSVTLTGKVTGAVGDVEYRFTELYNEKETVLQDYGTNNEYTFTTTGVGRHIYYLEVRDSAGNTGSADFIMDVVYHPGAVLSAELVSNKTSNEYLSRDIELTAAASGGYGELQYQFTEVYNGKTTVVQKYSRNSQYLFRTTGLGLHTYYVDIKDSEGQSARASYSVNVVMHPGGVLKDATLVSSKTSNEYIWRDIRLTAGAEGGYGKLQYQFTEVYNGKTTVVQEYSTNSVYDFQTSGEGRHIYYVDIKDEEGQSVRASYTMNVVMYPGMNLRNATLVSSMTNNEYVWRKIELTANANGGYGELQYQFTEVYNGKTTIVQEYSTDNVYRFETSGKGQHTYYVDIKDEVGQTVRASYTMNVVIHPTMVLGGTLTSNKTSTEYIWRDIELTAASSGGYGVLQYQFTEVYDGKTEVVQAYSTENVYKFRTTGPGRHVYYVDIKDESGQTIRLSYQIQVVVLPSYQLNPTITSNKTANEYVARTVTLTGTPGGAGYIGYGGLEYQFSDTYNGTTTIVQNYSSDNKYTFNTTKPGRHVYTMTVRDSVGQEASVQYVLQVVVHPSCVLTGTFTKNVSGEAANNQRIVLTAQASKGYGAPYTYQFTETYGGRTTTLQSYSTKNTCEFNISGQGVHTYQVSIMDCEGQTITLTQTISLGKNGWYYENGYKFYYINGVKQLDLDGILPKQSSYYIEVNRTTCSVTVYAQDGSNGYIIPVKRFACSVGLPSTPTPTGTYYTQNKYRWHTLMGPSYGQYCTRIVGGVLFHSVAGYNMTSYNLKASDFNKLGSPASHGCVRLCVRDAKWIYDNCSLGTRVRIYDSSDPGPLGKPETIKIPSWQNWDPTDPNV